MDVVTTAIVAAVLASAGDDEQIPVESQEKIVDAYDDFVVLLEEQYLSDSRLIEAIYQLEDEDTAAHRQQLHQEVKIAQADQEPALVQAAQELLDLIANQPHGNNVILKARTWREL